jgi:hypothetical protein
MLLIKKSSQQSIFHSEREPDGPEKSQRGKIFIRILLFYQFTAPFVNCGGPKIAARAGCGALKGQKAPRRPDASRRAFPGKRAGPAGH